MATMKYQGQHGSWTEILFHTNLEARNPAQKPQGFSWGLLGKELAPY